MGLYGSKVAAKLFVFSVILAFAGLLSGVIYSVIEAEPFYSLSFVLGAGAMVFFVISIIVYLTRK